MVGKQCMWMKDDYLVVIILNLRILSYLCVGSI